MSHMIPSGTYMICNFLYQNRYVCMSGNKDLVGHDVGDIIKVEVKNEVEHLATLYDTATELYIGIDMMDSKVKGYAEPKVLQLSSDDKKKFEIHVESVNDVCVLKDGKDLSEIVVEAAPASDVRYWTFEQV